MVGLLLAVGLSAAAFLVPSGVAQASDTVAKPLRLFPSGKCAEVRFQDGLDTPGARIQLRTCNGRTEQQWFDVGISDTSPNLKYVNKWSGMCLQARDNSRESGAIIDQGRCQPALPSQMWTKLYTAFGFYKLINIGSRLTLDVVGGSTSEFTLFTQQPDHGGCCQAWYPG